MKKRNIFVVFILYFVTLGIFYVLWWLYTTRNDLIRQNNQPKSIPSFAWLLVPIGALLAMLPLAAVFSSFSKTDGLVFSPILYVLGLLAVLTVIVIPFWWMYHYFDVLQDVTQGNDKLLMYVFWIICFVIGFLPVWMLLAQNDINKYLDRAAGGPGPLPPAPDNTSSQPPAPQPPVATPPTTAPPSPPEPPVGPSVAQTF